MLLKEDAEGNAVAVAGKAIAEKDLAQVKEIVDKCPERALSIVESNIASKRGADGLKELLVQLEKKAEGYTAPRISNKDIPFTCKEHMVRRKFSNRANKRFSSESQAKSTAREEFQRLYYSETAYRPVLKEMFVDYKVNSLKPYYIREQNESSFYFKLSKEIENFLKQIYSEACELNEKAIDVSNNWASFQIDISKNDYLDIYIGMLEHFDNESTSSGIMTEFKSRGEYTNLNWYINQMDFDCMELYDGEGLFGRTKYKKEWSIQNFDTAAEEFLDDFKSAIKSQSSDITDSAVKHVNNALAEYEKIVREKLKEKVVEFKRACNI